MGESIVNADGHIVVGTTNENDTLPSVQSLNITQVFKDKLMGTVKELVKCKDELALEAIWLFGSLARGDYTGQSDIDIMVITSGDVQCMRRKVAFMDVEDDIDFPNVDVVVKTYKSLESDAYVFNDFVKHDKILLWERKK